MTHLNYRIEEDGTINYFDRLFNPTEEEQKQDEERRKYWIDKATELKADSEVEE